MKQGQQEQQEQEDAVTYYDNDFDWASDLAPTAAAKLSAIPRVEAAEAQRFLAPPEGEAGGSPWEMFYQLHSRSASVYKSRRYLSKAFTELVHPNMVVLEVGCGLGSSLASVLERNPTARCFACDVSSTALQLLHAKLPPQHAGRVQTFRCDVAAEPERLRAGVDGIPVDLALLVFTLSAIDPRRHVVVLRHLHSVLRPESGLLLFRDYGLYDTTQLRSRLRLDGNLFARQDGTLAFYFTPEYFVGLLRECGGWEVVECKYACVRNANRATGQVMDRVFLHAKVRAVALPPLEQEGCRR